MATYQEEVRKEYRKARADGHKAVEALRTAKFEAKYGKGKIGMRHRAILPHSFEAFDGEEVTELPNGWKIKVEFERDYDCRCPWEDCDGVGVIREGYGHPGDAYENWIMNDDRGWYRWYDWKATLPEALREGWDAKPYRTGTKHERAMCAMKSTYEYLEGWCQDRWWYVTRIVTLLDEDDNEIAEDSCGGYESNAMEYLCSEARNMAAGMIVDERKARRESARQERVANRFRDAMQCGL